MWSAGLNPGVPGSQEGAIGAGGNWQRRQLADQRAPAVLFLKWRLATWSLSLPCLDRMLPPSHGATALTVEAMLPKGGRLVSPPLGCHFRHLAAASAVKADRPIADTSMCRPIPPCAGLNILSVTSRDHRRPGLEPCGPDISMFSGWRRARSVSAASYASRSLSGARPTIPWLRVSRSGNQSAATGTVAMRRRLSVKGRG